MIILKNHRSERNSEDKSKLKTSMSVLANVGLNFIFLGTIIIGLWTSAAFSDPDGYIIGYGGIAASLGGIFACLGTIFALIGGTIARTRFLWIYLIVVGFLFLIPYFASFFEPYTTNMQAFHNLGLKYDIFRDGWPYNLMFIVPGIICILEGIILFIIKTAKRYKLNKASHEHMSVDQ